MRIMMFLVVAAAIAVLQEAETAEIHVGGNRGWLSPGDPNFYSTWARGRNFTVGDVLVFTFAAGAHNVAGVTEDAYDNCNTSNPRFVNTNSPFRFTLDKDDDYYFICTVPTHCGNGQKLAITDVKEATGPSRPPSGSPTPTTPTTPGGQPPSTVTPRPPSPPNAATTFASAFTVVFISIAVTLIFNH